MNQTCNSSPGRTASGNEKNETLVSLIVPVYNSADCLPKMLEGIARQTYGSYELILIDDGSTDGSLAICEEAAREDARIRVIHQENSGMCAARNRGLSEAKGDYIR